ncbi:LysM peptidoglycan-binding domain-containing protein [Haloechinothrix salitolerans]|uniref:LysM peptidoglycan-binding domain-containing protein n=1 Tax=Haloechinothrix salitolerans TaxID=926830 RepID=A0ABW2C6X6_9PSEU
MTRRILTGIGALIALALITFGLPTALLVLGGDPRDLLPHDWPAADRVAPWAWYRLRDAWNTGALVFDGLLLIGWLAWLTLVGLIAFELVIQLRYGVAYARRRAAGLGPRYWISSLVSSILLLGSAAEPGTEPPALAEIVSSAPQHPTDVEFASHTLERATPGGIDMAEPDTPTTRCPTITTVAGDTLEDLAEHHLGDSRRFTEIMALNRDLLRRGPDYLEIGWSLLLPPDATGLPEPDKTRPCPDDRHVEVEAGDTLWTIAAREFRDPTKWPAIFQANFRQPQPDGRALRRPDLILPGWRLRIPASALPATGTEAEPQRGRATAPGPSDPTTKRPDPPASTAPPAPPTPAADQPPEPPDPSDSPLAAEPQSGTGISLPTGAFLGLGLAALITAAAITVRLWRQRIWPPGSLRRDELTNTPIVRAMRLAHDMAALPRDRHGDLIAALHDTARPGALGVRDRALATAAAVASGDERTTIGIADGRTVAVDLARTGGLGLTGPGAAAAARALIADLLAGVDHPHGATPPGLILPRADADHLLGDISELTNTPARLHATETAQAALDWVEAELLTRGRTQEDERAPLVLVCTNPTDQQRRLRGILQAGATAGISAIILGDWPSGVTVRVGPDGHVEHSVGTTDIDVDLRGTRLFALPTDDTRELLDILGQADATTDPTAADAAIADAEERPTPEPAPLRPLDEPPPPHPRVTIPPDPNPDSPTEQQTAASDGHAATAPPVHAPLALTVLGRMHLHHREHGDLIANIEPKKREILTLLALHPDGIRRDTLLATLWPDISTDTGRRRLHGHLSRLREQLRPAIGDACRELISRDDKHYSLNPRLITVDLWTINTTLRRHTTGQLEPAQTLDTLLHDYHAQLAPDLDAVWLETEREHLHQQIVGVMRGLLRCHNNDPHRKLAALDAMRRLDPTNEGLHREIIRIHAELGQHEEIDTTIAALTRELGKFGEHPSAEIIDLARELRARQPER